jgi:hypothetical protein
MWAAVEYSKQYDVYIWADSFDDAWEELVEYLDAHAPEVFETIGEDELKEAADDLNIPWKATWPDWQDRDFEKVVEHAEADYTMISHTTLKSGGTHIRSDMWGGDDVTDGDELNEVWTLSAESCEDDEEYEPPDGITRTRPSKYRVRKGMKIDPTLDAFLEPDDAWAEYDLPYGKIEVWSGTDGFHLVKYFGAEGWLQNQVEVRAGNPDEAVVEALRSGKLTHLLETDRHALKDAVLERIRAGKPTRLLRHGVAPRKGMKIKPTLDGTRTRGRR